MNLAPRNPADDARMRYNQSFQSNVFVPEDPRSGRNFHPAGKRRDQTTGEMFGGYNDKDLKAMPKTFEPKEDDQTHRQKKQQFLASDVLPRTVYGPGAYPSLPSDPRIQDAMMPHNTEERIDPIMRRQQELGSEMFGRPTPQVSVAEARDLSKRLTPNDFDWKSHPEGKVSPTANNGVGSKDRSYHEKCSSLFDHQSPSGQNYAHFQSRKDERQVDTSTDQFKRSNIHASDIFGTSGSLDGPMAEGRRAKNRGDREERVVLHQDWTDSKTEIMHGSRRNVDAQPNQRRANELHSSQVFTDVQSYMPPSATPAPMTYDNVNKVTPAPGRSPKGMHQQHLQSSFAPDGFYNEAAETKHWEVVELHISGLPLDADDHGVKRLCTGFAGLQIVKVAVDMDPVRNLCKGRAKVMLRYNPVRDNIGALVQKLEQQRLSVEV